MGDDAVALVDPITCEQFWERVRDGELSLSHLGAREAMEQLNEWLQPSMPDLAVEISGKDSGRRELILTAHGCIDQFQNLQMLVTCAPALEWFDVSAFRRRTRNGFGVRMDAFELNTKDVLVSHSAEWGQIALELSFAREIPMDYLDRARQMAFIMLDHMLGEYDFAIKVGSVDFRDPELSQVGVPLDEFSPVFDAFWTHTLGHGGLFPEGEHEWTGMTVSQEDDEQESLVMRNDSANALVGRADLGWRLDVGMAVPSTDRLDVARAFENAITGKLLPMRDGVCSHVVIGDHKLRTMTWYVADGRQAVMLAQQLARSMALDGVQIDAEFDPAWSAYLQWSD